MPSFPQVWPPLCPPNPSLHPRRPCLQPLRPEALELPSSLPSPRPLSSHFQVSAEDLSFQLRLWSPSSPSPRLGPGILCHISTVLNNVFFNQWFRINKDHERIPERIPEAVCLCQGCISFEKMKHTLDYTSVPVTANMQVYRRTSCKKGQFQYKMAWIEIAVACTCVFPKVTS
uniref:Interleukin-17C n=1 Tax=Callorhinchus milii TaxID=7868 RepID=A0A4W3HMX7_CALMI